MQVMQVNQVRDISNISPSNERWTKRYQWEKYANVDKSIMPLDPTVARKLKEIDDQPVEIMNDLDAYQEKNFDEKEQDISEPLNKHQKRI